MIIRQLTPRHFHGSLFAHRLSPWRRCLATEIETATGFENNVRESAGVEHIATGALRSSYLQSAPTAADNVVDSYLTLKHLRTTTGRFGSELSPHYQPHTLLTNPPFPNDVTLELLLASQAHLGHSTSLWNPANSRYIFGIREGIHIISLDITAAHLRRAAKVVSGVCERGGLVLFVGTRAGHDRCVVKAAQMAGGCHLFERWTPGSITNGQQILGRCRMMVVDEFDREVSGFDEQLVDRSVLKPDLVICLNPLENYVMLHECALANIPTIGVIDTDANPTWVTYPIPANDDSIRCIQVIAGVLGRAGQEGQAKRRTAATNGRITYAPSEGFTVPEHDQDEVLVPGRSSDDNGNMGSAESGLIPDQHEEGTMRGANGTGHKNDVDDATMKRPVDDFIPGSSDAQQQEPLEAGGIEESEVELQRKISAEEIDEIAKDMER